MLAGISPPPQYHMTETKARRGPQAGPTRKLTTAGCAEPSREQAAGRARDRMVLARWWSGRFSSAGTRQE